LQCGFCTPGMVIAIDQLLRDNANPSEAEVRRGLDGNLCRCTGYQNIVKSALSAGRKLRGEEPFEKPDVAMGEQVTAGVREKFGRQAGLFPGRSRPNFVGKIGSVVRG